MRVGGKGAWVLLHLQGNVIQSQCELVQLCNITTQAEHIDFFEGKLTFMKAVGVG